MADDIRSDIIINVDTSVGIAEIKNLQRQISQLNAQLLQSGAKQAQAAQNIQRNLINNINATGKFAANVRTISTTAESFTTALERNKLSMGEYFRYAGASTKTFGRLFKSEFATIEKVARERVKTLQTQFIKLGRDGSGAMKAISVRPLALDMENLGTQTAIAAQKQQLFNQLLKQGSTNLLNFGKNTQWAGRQLMVGFSIPLAYLGTMAGKTFMKMEEQAIRFRRVYGDTFTATEETDKMIEQVQQLAKEFTKYGVEVTKTMELAADAAAMGLQNADLLAQVAQSTRLAVLGGVEQKQALETTISLTSAFGTSARDLAKDIEFLNAVENQTVTAIEDLTIAIPKAAPVIKQLGGDVQDLAFFLTAMKEGGINASEGANALKSGLASLINPTEKAAQFLKGFGIDLKGLVDANMGDVKGLVIDFAQALDQLDPLNRARAIEQLFGKFQFARLSTLFQNVIKEGTQASRVLDLTKNSTEELAILAERELKRVEDSPMFKFKKAVEELQTALVPLGEAFVKAITPVIEFAKGFLDRFNSMGEGAKNFAVIATTVVAGIGPILLMTFGLIANGVANLIKMFGFISKVFQGAGASSKDLAFSTEYMTQQQLEAAAVASSLDQSHAKLIQTFNVEASAVDRLATSYGRAVIAQSKLLNIPIGPTNPAGQKPLKLNRGIVSVPGPKGAGDVVPAMLSPGEAVIPAKQSEKYSGLISGMINDTIPGFNKGLNPFAALKNRVKSGFNPRWSVGESIVRFLQRNRENYGPNYEQKLSESFLRSPGKKVAVRMFSDDFVAALSRGDKRYKNIFETGGKSRGSLDEAGGQRALAEEKLFGLGPNVDPSKRPAYGYLFKQDMGLDVMKPGMLERLTGIKRSRMSDPYTFAKRTVGDATKLMNPNTYRYGDIAMVLKNRALRGRTTVTQGDSLNAFLNQYATPAKLGTRNRKKLRAATPSSTRREFFEAQILGGFSFKDIKRIVATEPETILRLQQTLKDAGIRGIKVGMPKMTMMQRLKKLVYGSKAYQQRMPRRQSEGPYAGKYWTDPRVIGGKKYYSQGVTGSQSKQDAAAINKARELVRSAPEVFKKPFANLDWGSRATEEELIKQASIRIGFTPNQMRDMLSVDLSHIQKSVTPVAFGGREYELKDWMYSNIVKDSSLVNRTLASISDLGTPKGSFLKGLDAKDIAKISGLSIKDAEAELSRIKSGSHPISRNGYSALKAIADITATSFPGMQTGKRSAVLSELLKFRLSDKSEGSYLKALEQGGLQVTAKDAVEKQKLKQLESKARQSQENILKRYEARLSPDTQSKTIAIQKLLNARLGGKIKRYNKGVVSVPGPKGKGDIIPAMLTPGEAVIPAEMSKKYAPLISAMVSDSVPGFKDGRVQRMANEEAMNRLGLTFNTRGDLVDAATKRFADKARKLEFENLRKDKELLDEQKKILKEQRAGMRGKMSAAGGGLGMVAGMGAMAYASSGGPGADIAGNLAMPLMMLPGILPMLTNPIGIAAVAIGGLAVAAFALNEQFKQNVKESYDLAMATGASAQSIKSLSEFAGRVSAGEIMDRRRAEGVDVFQIAAGKTGFGASFLQSEAGKSMKEAFAKAIETQGRDSAISQLTNQMAVAVASGALSAGQARDIVATLGKELDDYSLSISVNSQLLTLLGPNGENLLTDPLEIRTRLVRDAASNVKSIFPELNIAEPLNASAAVSAANGGVVNNPIFDFIRNTFGGGLNLTGKEEAAAIGQFAALSSVALQTQQEVTDSLAIQYEQLINSAQAQGDLAEVARLRAEYEKQNSKLLLENANVVRSIRDEFSSVNPTIQSKILQQYKELSNQLYKDDPIGKAILEGAEKQISDLTDDKEVIVRASILSGDLSPSALTNLLGAEDSDKQIELLVKLGGAGFSQASQLADLFGDGKTSQGISSKQQLMNNLFGMSPEDALAYINQFNTVIQSFSALGEKSLQLGLSFYLENPELLEKANTDIDKFAKISKGKPITISMVQEVYGQEMVDQIKQDQEYFDSLPDDQKIIYTTVLKMIGELDPTALKIQAINEAMKSGSAFTKASGGLTYQQAVSALGQNTADKMAVDSFITDAARDVTEASKGGTKPGGNKSTNTGGDKSKPTAIDDILAQLKKVRDAAIAADGGIKELDRILGNSKNISKFLGTNQQMRGKGIGEDFIEFLNGLEKAERKKYVKETQKGFIGLTKQGQLLNKAFKEVAIGEFQDSMAGLTVDSNNQLVAFRRLVSGGMSLDQAMTAVQDSTLAAAIASKSFSAQELKKVVAEANRAEKAMNRFKAVTSLRQGIQETGAERRVAESFFTNRGTKFNEIEQAVIQLDPALLQTYTDFLSGKIGSLPAEFGERLKQLMSDPEFQKKVFDNAFGSAMNAFSVLEDQIRLDFELGINESGANNLKTNLTKLRDDIALAENDIANISVYIDDYDAGLSIIADQEEAINEEYDKKLEALDKIERINDSLINQQKSQLSLAEAITQGDIAAAAQAAQELRANAAADSIQSQRDLLEASRVKRLEGLTATVNKEVLTREEIEKRIKKLQKDIFDIEEQRLEPAREAVRQAEFLIQNATKALTVAGLTKTEWEQQKNAIESAIVSSNGYQTSLTAALGLVKGIVDYWTDLDGKVVTTTHVIKTVTDGSTTQTSPGVLTPPAPGWTWDDDRGGWKPPAGSEGSTVIGGEFVEVKDKPNINPNQAQIDMINDLILTTRERVRSGDYKDQAQKQRLMDINEDRIRQVRALGGVAAANGGLIPKRYAMGGLVKRFAAGGFALGTDTIPAMLTPGEFVIQRSSVEDFGIEKLRAINSGTYKGDSMYNYEVNVNVKSDANPDQIARAVMTQIKQIDSQRIRSNRF